jgi:hypothetical protein
MSGASRHAASASVQLVNNGAPHILTGLRFRARQQQLILSISEIICSCGGDNTEMDRQVFFVAWDWELLVAIYVVMRKIGRNSRHGIG